MSKVQWKNRNGKLKNVNEVIDNFVGFTLFQKELIKSIVQKEKEQSQKGMIKIEDVNKILEDLREQQNDKVKVDRIVIHTIDIIKQSLKELGDKK
jgi:hypothetical protein